MERIPHVQFRTAQNGHRDTRQESGRIGPKTAALVDLVLRTKPHPEQGFRACLGIVRLVRPHGRDALEAACLRSNEIGGLSYSSVKSILQNNLHRRRPETPAEGPAITHPNIRRTRGAPTIHWARLWRDAPAIAKRLNIDCALA